MSNILVFGDSGSFGAWDLEGGWVQRLRNILDKVSVKQLPNFVLVYNLSISGDTTKGILNRFDSEVKARLHRKAEMIMFSVGVNDSRKINGKPAVSLGDYKKNILKLIKKSKSRTDKIFFLGLTPIYPPFVQWSESETYDLKDIKEYNDLLRNICKENKVHYVEIFDELSNTNIKDILEDELHYNSKGHKMIFEIVRDYLKKENLI